MNTVKVVRWAAAMVLSVALSAAGADDTPGYVGDVNAAGEYHGHGVLTTADGSLYSGEVNDDGQPHGQGVMTARRNGRDISRYEGGFRDGLPHGQGVKVWWNGSRYEGEWRDGNEHGQGVMTWSSGAVHEGKFRDGRPYGQGIEVQPDGRRSEGGMARFWSAAGSRNVSGWPANSR